MTKNEMSINFSGLTHDHSIWSANDLAEGRSSAAASAEESTCSTIAILRRHPMYDCLVLVKKYRECLNGYSLEFPTNKINDTSDNKNEDEQENSENNATDQTTNQQQQQDENSQARMRICSRRKLVSRFLDGDDPMYQLGCTGVSHSAEASTTGGLVHPISTQLDDDLARSSGELVHVPVNGLLDRLKNYTQSGLAVDSRVYAFAMGLKTAERILTTGSMREIQETPI